MSGGTATSPFPTQVKHSLPPRPDFPGNIQTDGPSRNGNFRNRRNYDNHRPRETNQAGPSNYQQRPIRLDKTVITQYIERHKPIEPPKIVQQLQPPLQPVQGPVVDDKELLARQKAMEKEERRRKRDLARINGQLMKLRLIYNSVEHVVRILNVDGVWCCLFGSLASRLYGCTRMPKDSDIIIIPPSESAPEYCASAEGVKAHLVSTMPNNFFLKDPKDPEATFKILYYREGPPVNDADSSADLDDEAENDSEADEDEAKSAEDDPDPDKPTNKGKEKAPGKRKLECKVDILLPGSMNIPVVPRSTVVWLEGERDLDERIAMTSLQLSSGSAPGSSYPQSHAHSQAQRRGPLPPVFRYPCVPFGLLILLKVQGWHDHWIIQAPDEMWKRRKAVIDERDLNRMFALRRWTAPLLRKGTFTVPVPVLSNLTTATVAALAKTEIPTLPLTAPPPPWSTPLSLSQALIALTQYRVRRICMVYPYLARHFSGIGFPDLSPLKNDEVRKFEAGWQETWDREDLRKGLGWRFARKEGGEGDEGDGTGRKRRKARKKVKVRVRGNGVEVDEKEVGDGVGVEKVEGRE